MSTWPDQVRQHIETWSARLPGRNWWPSFVYHFTDLHNARSILASGKLHGRAEAIRLGLVQIDAASPDVIAHTARAHTEYARLYFRPRTPTQFRNEGIRTKTKIWSGAHCPVPVFLCFDAAQVLTMDSTELSDGNMASGRVEHGPAPEMLDRIPFHHVFHDGRFLPEEAETIKFHRHAEVLVPVALDLQPSLRMIVCRSPAERTTLLHLLPGPARRLWGPRVRIDYQALFERRWTFVESVTTIGAHIEFRFNPSTETPGPFGVGFLYQETEGGRRVWNGPMGPLSSTQRFDLAGARRGVATLTLDGCTAFSGPVTFDDTPF